MHDWIALALFTWLAVISPGADFALITRTSLAGGRQAGLLAAAGISCGVLLHASYILAGAAWLLPRYPGITDGIRLAGAAWLIWIGIRTFGAQDGQTPAPAGSAFLAGFLTNALNPKTMLFILAAFTQLLSPATPALTRLGAGAFMALSHLAWFGLVATLFTHAAILPRLQACRVLLSRLTGAALAMLGSVMAFGWLTG